MPCVEVELAFFKRTADAQIGARGEVDDPPLGEPLASRVEDDEDPRRQPLHDVLADDHAGFARIQLDRAADRERAHAADELLDQRPVKQRAAILCQQADRRRRREAFAVRGRREQSVIRIADGGDGAEQVDLVAAQPPRVPGAILAFVMQKSELREFWRQAGNDTDDVGGELDVLFQELALFRGERRFFVQQRDR